MLRLLSNWRESDEVPSGWRPADPPGAVVKVAVRNRQLRRHLRQRKPGTWRKVYRKGRDGSEVHYFEHESGSVANVKYKPGRQ